ncbi:hypothetical protein M422DRAFT_273423 [Sphaerobolus stellatus SS14]|uniref:Uncharacterized protein n=1 Tax=Sphaerobolus stellatus (strain SS14) TaxID=990650 RepID=A0A0C9UK21_SPHS4|nr:hypothetical protein M422DRAFT_273423 [Sphaerobolus stellatus SS14]
MNMHLIDNNNGNCAEFDRDAGDHHTLEHTWMTGSNSTVGTRFFPILEDATVPSSTVGQYRHFVFWDSTSVSESPSEHHADQYFHKDASVTGTNVADSERGEGEFIPHPEHAHYTRLDEERLPPNSYDLVLNHVYSLSNDSNGPYQCRYVVRDNCVCLRSFEFAIEAMLHVAEDHFKNNKRFQCCCGRVFTKKKSVQEHIARSAIGTSPRQKQPQGGET